MTAREISIFREKLSNDSINLTARRTFHEHYEWLESYWQHKYRNNYIDKFTDDFGEFYWNLPKVKKIALKFSTCPPIGSSSMRFEATESVKRATFFLKYFSGLQDHEESVIGDEKDIGYKWSKSSFNGLLVIIKQIRDNLFHGRKTDINEKQYNRNKRLVLLAVELTTIILDNLELAEKENMPK